MKELKILKQIKLSDPEKKELFNRVQEKAGISPKSPYTSKPGYFYEFSFLVHNKYAKVAILACLILFLTSATAYASLDTLPGDLLYPVKTKFVEKVADLITFSSEGQAKRDTQKIKRRIEEFEKLAEKGKVTENNTKSLEKNINENLDDFDHNLKEIKNRKKDKKEENTEMEDNLEIELESDLEEHAEKIIEIRKNEKVKDKKALESVLEHAKSRREKILEEKEEIEEEETKNKENENKDEDGDEGGDASRVLEVLEL